MEIENAVVRAHRVFTVFVYVCKSGKRHMRPRATLVLPQLVFYPNENVKD